MAEVCAALDHPRHRRLRRARLGRLRRRLLGPDRRRRVPRRARARDDPALDGARLGGQPRLADLRPGDHLDRVPAGLRLDLLDAVHPAVHRRDRDHLPRHRVRPARAGGDDQRGAGARRAVRLGVGADPVRVRRGAGRDRLGPRGRRQRGRRSVVVVAEPDLGADRRDRGADRRVPGRGLPRGRLRARRAARPRAGVPARARCWSGAASGVVAIGGLLVLRSDARAALRRPHLRRRARDGPRLGGRGRG